MRVRVDLHGEVSVPDWTRRHGLGLVPDAVPYGLDKMTPHGVEVSFRAPRAGPGVVKIAKKVRGRLKQADFVTAALRSPAVERLRGADRAQEDAVLCWDERTGTPAALVPGGAPVVSGVTWLANRGPMPQPIRMLTGRSLRRMAAIYCLCEPTARQVEREWGLHPESVARITMGVDEVFYQPLPAPEVPGLVVSVGDDSRRDHAALIRVVSGVVASGVPAQLELATTHKDVHVPAELGMVHRRRMEGSIRELYARGSVVAVALRPEPGIHGVTVALEAMACGRPIVITGNPGMEEYIEDGVTGILVPPGDELAFRDAVSSLLKDADAATAMGLAARRAVEERFTTGHTAAELAALLHRSV